MNDILILGGGKYSEVIIEIIEEFYNYNIIGILDDDEKLLKKKISKYEILGCLEDLNHYDPNQVKFVLSIGDNKIRKRLFEKFRNKGYQTVNLIHADTTISKKVYLGEGIIINSGVRIHPNVRLGNNIFVGMNATISHDSIIEDNVNISPGVNIAGEVHISENVFLGSGAVVIQGVSIGKNSIIGAGAVVVKNIPDNCIAVGVPAKPIKFLG